MIVDKEKIREGGKRKVGTLATEKFWDDSQSEIQGRWQEKKLMMVVGEKFEDDDQRES